MAYGEEPVDVLRRTRDDAIDAAERLGARRLLKDLRAARDDLARRLAQAKGLEGPGKDSFTAAKLELALRQVEDSTKFLARRVRGHLIERAEEGAEDAAGGLLRYMDSAERKFRGISTGLRIKEAAVLDRAAAGARSSLLRRLSSIGTPEEAPEDAERPPTARQGILERYGVETVGSFEGVLRRGMLSGATWGEVRDGITAESPFLQGQPRYWAERIVRTETMGAQNRAAWEGMRAVDDQLGDLLRVISCAFDDRTGADSYAVHGQIRRVDEAFESWYGAFMHPPDRPNDRAVVVAHRMSWPLPPYLQPRGDEEVAAAWARERRKGGMPPRPLMTTVPLSQIGRDAP